MRRVAAAVVVTLAASAAPLLACPVCFQVEPGPVTNGVRAAVVVLMAVTTSVLGGFAMFIVGFVRRAQIDSGSRFRHEPAKSADSRTKTTPGVDL
jgi:membrane protein YqaA with SNARE-associated domain